MLTATNEALQKLTNDVNQQFDNMKAYVDSQLYNEKKATMGGKYI